MASPFGFVSGTQETVPFSARYAYPSQATKALQTIVKLPPKNGGDFGSPPTSSSIIRFEFPASGYLNPQRTVLEFDFYMEPKSGGATPATAAWIQNNIKSIFRRVRVLYGANPIEDIQNYNSLVRSLTEVVIPNPYHSKNEVSYAANPVTAGNQIFTTGGNIGGILEGIGPTGLRQQITNLGLDSVPVSGTTLDTSQRYAIQLDLGVLQQGKLIPLKWMSAQLAIELEVAAFEEFAIVLPEGYTTTAQPCGKMTNVNIIATLMEFDNSYDAAFFKGMMAGGIPLKFSSWHNTKYAIQGTTSVLQIQERARSVKQAFACIRDQTASAWKDNGAMYSCRLRDYQWRLGGVFFPSSPVIVNTRNQAITVPSSGAEAFVELQKAIGCLGDYQAGSNCDWLTYAGPFSNTNPVSAGTTRYLARAVHSGAAPGSVEVKQTYDQVPRFLIGCQFETSSGFEISGVNAEEQSDLQLTLNFIDVPSNRQAEVYIHYDALLVVRPNNEIDLIQ